MIFRQLPFLICKSLFFPSPPEALGSWVYTSNTCVHKQVGYKPNILPPSSNELRSSARHSHKLQFKHAFVAVLPKYVPSRAAPQVPVRGGGAGGAHWSARGGCVLQGTQPGPTAPRWLPSGPATEELTGIQWGRGTGGLGRMGRESEDHFEE